MSVVKLQVIAVKFIFLCLYAGYIFGWEWEEELLASGIGWMGKKIVPCMGSIVQMNA